MGDGTEEFYYCLHHRRVETSDLCRAALRMGPYDSAEEAQQYADTAARRNEAWDQDDERWHGS